MASTQGSAPLPTGCYKCGRPGHWSRDCPALPRGTSPAEAAGQGATGPFGGGSSGVGGLNRGISRKFSDRSPLQGPSQSGLYNKKDAAKEIAVKDPRKKPKLTADLLLSENGLGYVLEKMPRLVSVKGREDTVVRDLKSLLEGYMHWHSLLLPYFSFDQFVDKVEKIGSSKRVRTCLRELREKIARGEKVDEDKGVGTEAAPGPAAENPFPKSASGGNETEVAPDINFDDMLADDAPAAPVNEDDFEEFYRQGVVEAADLTTERASTSEGPSLPQSDIPPPVLSPQPAVSINAISEAAAARMETNRLRALERAQSRAHSSNDL